MLSYGADQREAVRPRLHWFSFTECFGFCESARRCPSMRDRSSRLILYETRLQGASALTLSWYKQSYYDERPEWPLFGRGDPRGREMAPPLPTRRRSPGARMKQMAKKKKASQPSSKTLPKAPTGIQGLDEITGGGLPRGRPTLVSGGAGSGKTLFGLEFLVRGATQYSEPGVFMSFEESIPDLTKNVASLGFDLHRLVADKKLFVDHVSITRSEFGETGEYDLDGLFIRIADAVQRVGAQRVVLDTIEALFGDLPNPGIVRAEVRRLFDWLKQEGLTTVITAERDQPDRLTRHGIEEFVSDCVILLDHRIREEISTRRLRIVKYRGSTHGTNEYPFLIDDQGISVLPISSLGLNHDAPAERVSSGIERLDGMLGGKGFYRGSSILASGTAGTGKTTIAACFVDAACRRGERSLFFAFEESPRQIVRNMRSIGIELETWDRKGLLKIHAARPN